jgi:uncharacterized membrane protein YoaK (UPF0700 family)
MLPAIVHRLAHRVRSRRANRQLGGLLAFVAGAINAGGFLAVQRYTSHMTGVISAVAADVVLGQAALAMAGISSLMAFLLERRRRRCWCTGHAGASCTANSP